MSNFFFGFNIISLRHGISTLFYSINSMISQPSLQMAELYFASTEHFEFLL